MFLVFQMYGHMIPIVPLVHVPFAAIVAYVFTLLTGMFNASVSDEIGQIGEGPRAVGALIFALWRHK